MPDLTLSVLVSRTILGLSDLQINDHTNYFIAPGSFGGAVTWNRTQVQSPYIDGAVTVNRTRNMVNDAINVEVRGNDTAGVHTNLQALLNAFIQDNYTITVSVNGSSRQYACEAADYHAEWTGPRWVANQIQVALTVPRFPVPISGVI